MRLLCLFLRRTKEEKASTLRTNAASRPPNQRAAGGRPRDFCYRPDAFAFNKGAVMDYLLLVEGLVTRQR